MSGQSGSIPNSSFGSMLGGGHAPGSSSSIHRRSLQDVDALGLFHHSRGLYYIFKL